MRTLALAAALAAALPALPAFAQEVRTAESFAAWRAGHEAEVAAFTDHLKQAGVAEVAALHQLLRSASDWQPCAAEPYAVPPADQWPAVLAVLKLLQTLNQHGVLGPFEVFSGYRGPELNKCAGGAPRSAHLRAFAVDLRPVDGAEPGPMLCTFWREQGRAWNMGLSRYPSGRIHIDTAGYRTWGADHTGSSAFCAAAAIENPAPAQPPASSPAAPAGAATTPRPS